MWPAQPRSRGLGKTHLQQVAIAAALNLERRVVWITEIPRAATRTSRFAALAACTSHSPTVSARFFCTTVIHIADTLRAESYCSLQPPLSSFLRLAERSIHFPRALLG
jgi:hypothetical protein